MVAFCALLQKNKILYLILAHFRKICYNGGILSRVAQWWSKKLLTSRLLVRVQSREPLEIEECPKGIFLFLIVFWAGREPKVRPDDEASKYREQAPDISGEEERKTFYEVKSLVQSREPFFLLKAQKRWTRNGYIRNLIILWVKM